MENEMETESPVVYAGFWWRVIAAFVDSLLISFLLYPMIALILNDPLGQSTASMLVQFLFPAVAIIAFWLAKSSTPGKMILGISIIDADTGGKPSTQQFIIRYLGYYVSTIPLMLGIFWVAFDQRKQGWHDKLAKTVVIRKP